MLFINATLSKNQLHKPKNQINKFPTIIKQDDIEFISKYFWTPIYFCAIIMVGFWFADIRGLCWRIMICCFERFLLVIRQELEQGYDY